MPKLNTSKDSHCWFPKWLKELARWIESVDSHNFEENRYIHEELVRIAKAILKTEINEPHPYDESAYEPQTYDEAIAVIKSWQRRTNITGLLCWKSPTDAYYYAWHEVDSWEKDKWPELWEEMVGADYRGQLSFYDDAWFWFRLSVTHKDSTPGRVVCQAYLYYRNHRDWAERLSK